MQSHNRAIIIIFIIINAEIKVTLNKEMLQGHYTKIITTRCQSGKEALNIASRGKKERQKDRLDV